MLLCRYFFLSFKYLKEDDVCLYMSIQIFTNVKVLVSEIYVYVFKDTEKHKNKEGSVNKQNKVPSIKVPLFYYNEKVFKYFFLYFFFFLLNWE